MEQDAALLYLVLVGIPLEIGGRAPLLSKARGELAHEVGFAARGRDGAGQGDARRLEKINLADGGAQPLAAAGAFEQAARKARADLVRVTEAGGIGIAIFAKELRVAEIKLRGVDDWKVALVAKGNAQVIEPWFQSLDQRRLVEGELTLKIKTAVEAVYRHAVLRCMGGAGRGARGGAGGGRARGRGGGGARGRHG